MASLTSNTDNTSPPPPALPSRDSDSYKISSQRTIKARALIRQRSDSKELDKQLEGLEITTVEESGIEEEETTTGETKTATTTTSSHSSRHLQTKSLADFAHVDEAINHAVDQNVTLPEAFEQLSYRNSQVKIVNAGVLRKPLAKTQSEIEREASPPAKQTSSCISSKSTKTSNTSTKKKTSTNNVAPPIATDISSPSAVQHKMHVKFNPALCRYDGLSDIAAKGGANQQYGVPLTSVPKCQVDGYDGRIPAILILLWNQVLKCEGHKCMGIFRLAADADEMKWIKKQLNTGQYDGDDIEENITATLIKIFFRELPTNLLNHLEKPLIDKIAGYDGSNEKIAVNIFQLLEKGMKEPYFSLLMWLLDIMGQVVLHKDINKMSEKNMAIVVAPNLYSIKLDMNNPMAAMTWTQRIAKFIEVVLQARMIVKPPIP